MFKWVSKSPEHPRTFGTSSLGLPGRVEIDGEGGDCSVSRFRVVVCFRVPSTLKCVY